MRDLIDLSCCMAKKNCQKVAADVEINWSCLSMTEKDGKSADCQMPIIWGCAEESSAFASSCRSRRKGRL